MIDNLKELIINYLANHYGSPSAKVIIEDDDILLHLNILTTHSEV